MSRRAVLITGAARRIGKALALALAADGWAIAVHCRHSQDAARKLVDQIRKTGGKAAMVQADLADRKALEPLVQQSVHALGPLLALINNASHFEDDRLPALKPDLWETHINVNLRAPVFLSQAFARQLPAQETGCIIHLGDQRIARPDPHFFSYAISKAALEAATITMAQALAPRIRVNAVAPGPTLASARQSEEGFAAQMAATLLGTGSPVPQIVQAVRYLLGAEALTGQTLIVDGGEHLAWPGGTKQRDQS